jgi:hypothetical protein
MRGLPRSGLFMAVGLVRGDVGARSARPSSTLLGVTEAQPIQAERSRGPTSASAPKAQDIWDITPGTTKIGKLQGIWYTASDLAWKAWSVPHKWYVLREALKYVARNMVEPVLDKYGPNSQRHTAQDAAPPNGPSQQLTPPPARIQPKAAQPVDPKSREAQAALAAAQTYLGRTFGSVRQVGKDVDGLLHVTVSQATLPDSDIQREAVVHLDSQGMVTGATLSYAGHIPQLALPIGDLPGKGGHFFDLPVEVQDGTAEVHLQWEWLDDTTSAAVRRDTLDWGIYDEKGINDAAFRGYGGGNTEPALFNEHAASRSYLVKPIHSGTWTVRVGAFELYGDSPFRCDVELRNTATLQSTMERVPYVPKDPIHIQGLYAFGDPHTHCEESGDSRAPLEQNAAYADSRRLDFIGLSDHNVNSQLPLIGSLQAKYPNLFLMPMCEVTTPFGHFGAAGLRTHEPVSDGNRVRMFAEMAKEIAALPEKVALIINHAMDNTGRFSPSTPWRWGTPPASVQPVFGPEPSLKQTIHSISQQLPLGTVHGVEIFNGSRRTLASIFDEANVRFADHMADLGHHISVVTGSDDHCGGTGASGGGVVGGTNIGTPVTAVRLPDGLLSTDSVVNGIQTGQTQALREGKGDPLVESSVAKTKDGRTLIRATVKNGRGMKLRLVTNGSHKVRTVRITDDQAFSFEYEAPTPDSGTWYRFEVRRLWQRRNVTSYLWPGDSSQ